jgi:hypothetical protein
MEIDCEVRRVRPNMRLQGTPSFPELVDTSGSAPLLEDVLEDEGLERGCLKCAGGEQVGP